MRKFNSDFKGDCCDGDEGLPKLCVTEEKLLAELQKKADVVNVFDKTYIITQLEIINARLSDIEARLAALEGP